MIVNSLVRTVCVSFSSLLCVAALTGCNSAPEPQERADYAKSLNRYYQGRPTCLWAENLKFPAENATADQIKNRGLDALVSAGLLNRKNAKGGGIVYDLTASGRAAFDADIADKTTGNFCYGRRKVSIIDSSRHDSPTTELVEYRYTVTEPASWAHDPAIQSAFPQVVADLAGPHTAKATLLNTTTGWEVSDRPAHPSNGERASSLSKMKAVLAPGIKQGS
jgi:hypothetical protein